MNNFPLKIPQIESAKSSQNHKTEARDANKHQKKNLCEIEFHRFEI